MLYNIKRKKIQNSLDCLNCEHFDKTLKKCKGYGKRCFEFDPKTMTIIDPVTRVPIKVIKEK